MSGEFAWGRIWGGAATPIRITPISFIPRDDLDAWLGMTDPPSSEGMCGPASDLLKPLRAQGAMFPQNLQKAANLVPAHVEMGLADLVARGLITCDSFARIAADDHAAVAPPSAVAARRPLELLPNRAVAASIPMRSTNWRPGSFSAAPASSSAAR